MSYHQKGKTPRSILKSRGAVVFRKNQHSPWAKRPPRHRLFFVFGASPMKLRNATKSPTPISTTIAAVTIAAVTTAAATPTTTATTLSTTLPERMPLVFLRSHLWCCGGIIRSKAAERRTQPGVNSKAEWRKQMNDIYTLSPGRTQIIVMVFWGGTGWGRDHFHVRGHSRRVLRYSGTGKR